MLNPIRRKNLLKAFDLNDGPGLASAWLGAWRAGQDPDEAMPEPFEDEWREQVQSALSEWTRKRTGYVYIAAYLLHRDVFKVGQTAREPHRRVASLRTAGVLAPLVLVHHAKVLDRHAVEAQAHALLAAQRVDREFFQAALPAVVAAVSQATNDESEMWTRISGRTGLNLDELTPGLG